jgi:hypothetical protein
MRNLRHPRSRRLMRLEVANRARMRTVDIRRGPRFCANIAPGAAGINCGEVQNAQQESRAAVREPRIPIPT